jgi:CPA2 family monovalent cation:H+ antiporter-2
LQNPRDGGFFAGSDGVASYHGRSVTHAREPANGMPHDTPLIGMIVAGIVLAFALGTVANRLRVSPLMGYLLAGVIVGPYTPGYVADQALANQLAEIGVILLMFGVGMHFSLKDLLTVKAIAIPGAVAQIAIATALGIGLAMALGWTIGAGVIFGLALSVASTVVLLRALQERHLVETERGRIAVGWLIVEDLAMVLALVLLPALADMLRGGTDAAGPDAQQILTTLAITFGKVGAFVALMLVVGRRAIPWLLHYVAHTGSRELFRLAVLAIALGVAFGAAKLFDVSFALGAFFAGMVLAESELSHQAANETLPLRDAFAVLFFVSVGMLFDPGILLRDPLPVLAVLFIILFGKSIAAFALVRAFRYPTATALTISASLAQIGEFSFILANLGVELDVMPERGRDLILVGAILSILANPLFFAAIDRMRPWIERSEEAGAAVAHAGESDLPITALTGHTVLIGYGRVGGAIGEALLARGAKLFVIEENETTVDLLRKRGVEAHAGNAAAPDLLRAANFAAASCVFVAVPNAFEAGQVVEQARAANAALKIVARAHLDGEVDYLRNLGANAVVMGEREIARAMLDAA